MFDYYKKYLLVRYAWDTGTDDGPDAHTKRDAERIARAEMRDGWETIACINTHLRRIEFVLGEPQNILNWFRPEVAALLAKNTVIPEYLWR